MVDPAYAERRAGEAHPADGLGRQHWYRALDLVERRESLAGTAATQPVYRAADDRGARRVARWRAQPPFHEDDALWRRRLESDGLDEALLTRLAGVELPQPSATPPWLATLLDAYDGTDARPFPWPTSEHLDRAPFLRLADPLVWPAFEALRSQAEALRRDGAPFEADVAARALVRDLPARLAPVMTRALIVELHAAGLEGSLRGRSAERRFDHFVASLGEGARCLEIFGHYPVLARQLVDRVAQWRAAAARFLQDLAADAETLDRRFGDGGGLGRLEAVRGAVGDPHRDGREVLLLRFDGGLELVYKPKSMAVERAFQDLVGWLNDRGLEPSLRTLEVVDRGDHGWIAFVHTAPCASTEALRRFYRRQGALLAVLHALGGTDFHHENLIAAGEHPVAVDLETLFQPRLDVPRLDGIAGQHGACLGQTVLRTHMLPNQVWGDGDRAGVDLSGLAAHEGQLTPRPVLTTGERGTDRMRIERRRVEIPLSEHAPRLLAGVASVLDFGPDLEAGFRDAYALLCRERAALLATDGPLERFRGAEIRVLARQTATYGALQLESYHPHLQGDAALRARFLDQLWIDVRGRAFLADLVPSEVRQLERGDIPLFTTTVDGRDLETGDGDRHVGFFEDSGLERARRLVRDLSPADLERQVAALRDALQAARLSRVEVPRPSYALSPAPRPATPEALLAGAARVTERLVQRAFEGPDEALWLSLDHQDKGGWSVVPTGPDLYQGLPGIALFLGYWGRLTGDAGATRLARLALVALRRQLAERPEHLEGVGAYSGWGGVMYVLGHLAHLWREPALLDEAERLAVQVLPAVADDPNFDVVGGAAGCLLCALALAHQRPRAPFEELAVACGERLLAAAVPAPEGGCGWVVPLTGPRPIGGISHGAAGAALALLRLAARTGDARYRRVAVGAVAFERAIFDPARRNWPDLRAGAGEDGEPHFMTAWCHGAPGIGLARLASTGLLDDPAIGDEIDHAVACTLAHGLGANHSLCHGDLGNLGFLLEVARARGDRDLERRVLCLAGGVLASLDADGPLCGLPVGSETPGLMLGLAGIGWGLAYLARPDRLPSLLSLAPPTEDP